mmetsp:Transcript_23161/g.64720  ORF Transcript_23161/g.64720 Transcript_23161/m.64720 type:complete len:223 (+) Transcript_23161:727-1395(+)
MNHEVDEMTGAGFDLSHSVHQLPEEGRHDRIYGQVEQHGPGATVAWRDQRGLRVETTEARTQKLEASLRQLLHKHTQRRLFEPVHVQPPLLAAPGERKIRTHRSLHECDEVVFAQIDDDFNARCVDAPCQISHSPGRPASDVGVWEYLRNVFLYQRGEALREHVAVRPWDRPLHDGHGVGIPICAGEGHCVLDLHVTVLQLRIGDWRREPALAALRIAAAIS